MHNIETVSYGAGGTSHWGTPGLDGRTLCGLTGKIFVRRSRLSRQLETTRKQLLPTKRAVECATCTKLATTEEKK